MYTGYVEKNTAELHGKALDWSVLVGLGWNPDRPQDGQLEKDGKYCLAGTPDYPSQYTYGVCISHSQDWNYGGPLLESSEIAVEPAKFDWKGRCILWRAKVINEDQYFEQTNLLVAAMRAFVYMKLGNKVAIPKELL